jgi:predicted nucleic acid-binding protein
LIVAATAELAGLIVVHVDKDFDVIAEVTGQPVERLVLA